MKKDYTRIAYLILGLLLIIVAIVLDIKGEDIQSLMVFGLAFLMRILDELREINGKLN